MTDTPDPIDLKVGALIRLRRKQRGLSQTALAEACGITFQQMQKYERAANRVSASMLVRIARKLETPPSYFFADLVEDGGDAEEPLARFSLAPHALEVAQLYPRLAPDQRNAVLRVMTALAGEGVPA